MPPGGISYKEKSPFVTEKSLKKGGLSDIVC